MYDLKCPEGDGFKKTAGRATIIDQLTNLFLFAAECNQPAIAQMLLDKGAGNHHFKIYFNA